MGIISGSAALPKHRTTVEALQHFSYTNEPSFKSTLWWKKYQQEDVFKESKPISIFKTLIFQGLVGKSPIGLFPLSWPALGSQYNVPISVWPTGGDRSCSASSMGGSSASFGCPARQAAHRHPTPAKGSAKCYLVEAMLIKQAQNTN